MSAQPVRQYNPPKAWEGVHPIERAAHLFGSFFFWRAKAICHEEGICDGDQMAGAELAYRRKVERQVDRAVHGSPEYGGGRW